MSKAGVVQKFKTKSKAEVCVSLHALPRVCVREKEFVCVCVCFKEKEFVCVCVFLRKEIETEWETKAVSGESTVEETGAVKRCFCVCVCVCEGMGVRCSRGK